jgi:hypothetical protein
MNGNGIAASSVLASLPSSSATSLAVTPVAATATTWRDRADEMPIPTRMVPNCVSGHAAASSSSLLSSCSSEQCHDNAMHDHDHQWLREEERQQRYIWSWSYRPTLQQPLFTNQKQLRDALTKIRSLPPLVDRKEVDELKRQLAECARGERFLLQGIA